MNNISDANSAIFSCTTGGVYHRRGSVSYAKDNLFIPIAKSVTQSMAYGLYDFAASVSDSRHGVTENSAKNILSTF